MVGDTNAVQKIAKVFWEQKNYFFSAFTVIKIFKKYGRPMWLICMKKL